MSIDDDQKVVVFGIPNDELSIRDTMMDLRKKLTKVGFLSCKLTTDSGGFGWTTFANITFCSVEDAKRAIKASYHGHLKPLKVLRAV